MGEFITLGESVIISAFSMLIVFAGLLLISLIISLLKVVSKSEKKKETKSEVVKEVITYEEDLEEQEEIVAVIAAAVAASLGVSSNDIIIKNIKRVNNMDSWTQAGLNEQMLSNL